MLVENIKKGGYTHVFAGHSAFGKNLMPRVAALFDVQQVSDITKIESEDSELLSFMIEGSSLIDQRLYGQSTLVTQY